MSLKQKRVAVIGAGIAGLSAGHELKKAGLEVTVFEKNNYPGGRMSTDNSSVLPFDLGVDFLINGWYSTLQSYAEELGVPWILSENKSGHRIMRGGIPRYVKLVGPLSIFKFDVLSVPARLSFLKLLIKIRFFSPKLNFFDLSLNPPELDKISATDYLSTRASKEISDYIADPFTSIMQFHRADEIGAGVLFSLLSEMMREGSKFRIAYTPHGMGEIPKALAKNLDVKYSQEITSVENMRNDFDAIIIATTSNVTKNLLPDITLGQKVYFEGIKYSSTATVSFKIPANMFADNSHLTYVPFVENKIISGYDNTIQKDRNAVHDGTSVLNVYLHEAALRGIESFNEPDYFNLVKSELPKVCPEAEEAFADIAPYKMYKWENAMPKFTGSHIAATREFLKTEQGKNNIYFAGDYLNAPWTEGAARSGVRAAEAIIKKFSK